MTTNIGNILVNFINQKIYEKSANVISRYASCRKKYLEKVKLYRLKVEFWLYKQLYIMIV